MCVFFRISGLVIILSLVIKTCEAIRQKDLLVDLDTFRELQTESVISESSTPYWQVFDSELSTSGASVTSSSSDSGSPYNALWKDGYGEVKGTHFWNVKINKLEGNVFVGITDEEKFGKGWNFKGLTYGGNLSNGGALLVSSFGPWPKEGDTIGVLLNREENIKIYFFVNGRPLGLAFDVPESTLGRAYPAVCFSGKGEVTIEKNDSIPENIDFEEEIFYGLEGNWQLDFNQFTEDDEPIVELPLDADPADFPVISLKLVKISNTTDMSSSDNQEIDDQPIETYQAHLSMINQVNFRFYKSKSGEWTTSPQATTLMMTDPVQDALLELTKDPSELKEENDILTMNKDSVQLQSSWTRLSAKKEPVTQNPFL